MIYTREATTQSPALIIFLLDVSASMNSPMGTKRRIDIAQDALYVAIEQMISRSGKGVMVAPRYRIAMLAYSNEVYSLLPGDASGQRIRTITEIAQLGIPQLSSMRTTDTALAFEYVEELLRDEMPRLRNCPPPGYPAPLVCHLTDGEYTGADPEPIARRIMAMQVPDGNVLIENIFISEEVLADPIPDPKLWPGIMPKTPLATAYANKLRSISSALPESYRMVMNHAGYHIASGALMMIPGVSPELVELGFVMASSTPFVGLRHLR